MIFLKERIGKLLEDLKELIYTDRTAVTEFRFLKSKERFAEVDRICTDSWERADGKQFTWGGHREYYWFETVVTIPEYMDGKCVYFELRTGREGEWDATNPQFTAYVNGRLQQGLDVNHRELLLSSKAKAGETYQIVLSAFTGDHNMHLVLDASIQALHPKTEQYYYDVKVPYEVAVLCRENEEPWRQIIPALNESLNLLDLRRGHCPQYDASLAQAQEYLNREFYEKYTGDAREKIYCVGHTHIDVAWLWTLAVTQDKAVRSFSTALELMRRYPEYIFMSSQPQLYQYVKKNAPDVYAEIRSRVAEGRWEPEGGMFLEADCNLTSGESLVRQILYGKRFFREEFGKDSEILWLPDVFGYSAALPQIMKKSGLRYFMTTKISWSEFNRMPCDTFEWEGIDGSRILTHFIPSRDFRKEDADGGQHTSYFTTYNGFLAPSQVRGGWERYSQKYLNPEALMSFGYGDGGGGPTREMLENQRRLSRGIPGCPQTVMATAGEFFHTLETHVKGKKYLPVWVGELYLEYHRGTYTSMARNKKYNRKAEFLMENLELLSEMAGQAGIPGGCTEGQPHELWEIVLRNQFHDILPGSSIQEVYEDSKAEYESLFARGRAAESGLLQALADSVQAQAGALVVFNLNSTQGSGPVEFVAEEDLTHAAVTDGTCVRRLQRTGRNTWLFEASGVPSKGYRTYTLTEPEQGMPKEVEAVVTPSCRRLENPFLRVSLDENGQLASVYDKKANRELLPEGSRGNVLMTYEDRPHNYDAWDLNNYYIEKSWEIAEVEELRVVEDGPVRATILVARRYLDSRIEQYLSLTAESPELCIRNEIDWKEKNLFLKALFPVDIHTDEATFEIQYGNVRRKTHYNTSWDFARFEVCMHKWLDVSEDGYGVSVLNDCKYGVGIHDGVIGLSLLKSAVHPNPAADREHHSFIFSVFPHQGDFREARTVDRAYALNNPLQCRQKRADGGTRPLRWSELQTDSPNVVIEVVKRAEDGADTIVRLYEAFNRRTEATVTFGWPVCSVQDCNLLEEPELELAAKERTVRLQLRPYEIRTLRVRYQEPEKKELLRYSVITQKNPREIVLLRGSGCKWKKCSFCDYHLDFSKDEAENYRLNREVLSQVTGIFGSLEVINSGSFCDLDAETMQEIRSVCIRKGIRSLRFESHWIHRKKIPELRAFFAQDQIDVKIKMGVETFEKGFREEVLKKGMGLAEPEQIAAYAQEVCLLFGLTGQTEETMRRDIETGLQHFERICVNIMNENTTQIRPDQEVIRLFLERIYPEYKDHPRVDILIENTEFGVGGF